MEDPSCAPPGHAVDTNHVHGQGDGQRRREDGAEQRAGDPEAGADERDPEDEAQRHADHDQRRQGLEPKLPLQDAVGHAERDGSHDVRSEEHRWRDTDVEEDAEQRRADDEHDDADRPREGQYRLQRVGGEPGDLVLAAARAKGRRLAGESRLEDGERNREDEGDGEQRRERPVLRRTEQTADDDVERVVRRVEQAEDEEEQERLPEKRPHGRRSECGRDGGATSHPIILDKLTPPNAPKRGRHVRVSGGCAMVALSGCLPLS